MGCFTICWLPYFVVACSQIFKFAENSSPTYYKAAFSLAMANSGMNPVIYAWKNRTFRRAFGHLLRCKAPDSHALIDDENARQNMKRKSSSLPPSLSAPPPTPNSIIIATPPPLSASSTDSYRRSSLQRYHHQMTAFPLPPPPPSPQSPLQQSMETMVVATSGSPSYIIATDSPPANLTLTKCCLKVVDLNDDAANIYCGCETPTIDIENNNEDHLNNQHYLHPNHQRWQTKNKNQTNIDDDLSKGNFKHFNNNCCNELFLHKLTNNSPAESIVSAPLTPTGNLIVNILENLENHHQTETLNRKNYRNSTNCIIRNTTASDQTPSIKSLYSEMEMPSDSIKKTSVAVAVPTPITSMGTVDCVIAINNNETTTETILRSANNTTQSNTLYCGRNYSKSSSAPQCINCWSE